MNNSAHIKPINKDILVIVLSTTMEKTYDFDIAAEGSRVQFISSYRVLPSHKVVDEDTGTREGNLDKKANEYLPIVTKLLGDGTEHQNLLRQCAELGIPFNPENIYLAYDDTTFTVSPAVWPFLREKLKDLVHKELLDKLGGFNDQESLPGPGAETGPIIQAVGGFLRFYSLLREAQLEAQAALGPNVDITIKNQSSVKLRRLSNPHTPLSFDSEVDTHLLAIPRGKKYASTGDLINPYDYVAEPSNPTEPLSTTQKDYIRSRSPRAKIFEQMNEQIFSKAFYASAPSIYFQAKAYGWSLLKRLAPSPNKTTHDFGAAYPDKPHEKTYTETMLERIPEDDVSTVGSKHLDNPEAVADALYEVLNVDPFIKKVGKAGRIFKPFNKDNQNELLLNMYEFFSFLVAKQLIARDMFKHLTIWDTGCWKEILKFVSAMANKGMAKDFVPIVIQKAFSGIQHFTTSFYDYFRFDDKQFAPEKMPRVDHKGRTLFSESSIARAAATIQQKLRIFSEEVAKERTRGYHDFIESPSPSDIRSSGKPHDGKRLAVCLVASATSDNRRVRKNSANVGEMCAKKGFYFVYGLMGQHGGADAVEAYIKNGGLHITGISTAPISAAESPNRHLLEKIESRNEKNDGKGHYTALVEDIYRRMAKMFAYSDVTVVVAGGWGTFQEWLAFKVARVLAPSLMKDKKFIIYNSHPYKSEEFSGGKFWDRGIKLILKTLNTNSDNASVVDPDTIIVNNAAALEKALDKASVEFEKRQKGVEPDHPSQQLTAISERAVLAKA